MLKPVLGRHAPARLSNTDCTGAACRLADGALVFLMVLAAFLLGCHELEDADVWWHLRAGRWIWENGAVPYLDPFTYASGDRLWIDLQWLFELILSAAFAGGGVRGVILLAATVCATVLAVVLALRDRRWPIELVVACWLPALLVMSARFIPRPEVFSLLWMAIYLMVLTRADGTPAAAWVLPPVQLLWVNTHGLFLLGPIILVAFLAERLLASSHRLLGARAEEGPAKKRWWIHLGGASALVGVACLANPYGVHGALFPFELFPKITAWGGPYKLHNTEFFDLGELMRRRGPGAAGNLYLRTECFLLWAMLPSFIVPALWRAERARTARTVLYSGALGLILTLILMSVLGFPAPGSSAWVRQTGRAAPLGLVLLGGVGAAFLVRTSRPAALLALIGSVSSASSMLWLRAHVLGPEAGPAAWIQGLGAGSQTLGWGTVLVLMATAGLVVRAGARLFLVIIAAAFSYLALQAVRNMNLFALAAGFVLTSNLAGWATEIAAADVSMTRRRLSVIFRGLAARVALIGAIGLLIFSIVTGRFDRATGEPGRFGLGELPLAYAHQAARFAGRAGLPDRALVLPLEQAGVYLFHNGPQRKPFMDCRLEVPSRKTFETYLRLENRLNEGRAGLAEPVRKGGNPLILLGHANEFGAEATLLGEAGWRCVYFDAVASVFLARGEPALSDEFPAIDFASRHFRDPEWQAMRPKPLGIGEGKALFNLGVALRLRDGASGRLPDSIMLSAGDRFRQAIADDPAAAEHWTMLGMSCWNLIADLTVPPPGPRETWDPARGIFPAQATFCYRRALELDPNDAVALASLCRSLEAREMTDTEQSATVIESLRCRTDADWTTWDRAAAELLHLGRTADALRVWELAPGAPSPAIRMTRIATALLAALDFQTAMQTLQLALKRDAGLGEAWFCLALVHVERGEPTPALAACDTGLQKCLTRAQRSSLERFKALLAPP
jgi:tetratricopeptide (TPR) repeat protein